MCVCINVYDNQCIGEFNLGYADLSQSMLKNVKKINDLFSVSDNSVINYKEEMASY